MPTQRAVWFLIVAAVWAQFDDVLLAPCTLVPLAQLADDDDEYPSVMREPAARWSLELPEPAPADLTPETACRPALDWGAWPGARLSGPFGRSPLYALMSLQL
jgi:hypothetical protein